MSTARRSIMRRQLGSRQSCSPPATSTSSAAATCAVHSSSQYGQGSSKWTTPCCSRKRPTCSMRISEHDQGAEGLTVLGGGKRVVDLLERPAPGDQLVQLQASLLVQPHELRD